jgi:hypothetical protein
VVPRLLESRKNDSVVYSDPLVVNGLTWRLKLYPNGTLSRAYIARPRVAYQMNTVVDR